MLIDTHAHLYWDSFQDDLDEVVSRAIAADVTTIINVGVDVEKSKEALKISQTLSGVEGYSTIGIHPHEALRLAPLAQGKLSEEIDQLEQIYLSAPEKVVGVGECGLDYAFSTSEESKPTSEVFIIKNLQKKLLQAQVDLAKKLNLPLIIHCRNAWDDIFAFLKDTTGILHCYSGDIKVTKKALQTNYFISFAGNATYPKNEYLREAIKIIPLERIVLETDCPFLPPQSIRGKRNEPSSVAEIAKLIAEIKDLSLEKIAKQTSANVTKLFAF